MPDVIQVQAAQREMAKGIHRSDFDTAKVRRVRFMRPAKKLKAVRLVLKTSPLTPGAQPFFRSHQNQSP